MIATALPIRERLKQRAREYCLAGRGVYRLEIITAASRYFAGHPDESDCYVCYSGEVIGGSALRSSMKSRTAQLVSLASIGVPLNVGRTAVELWREVWGEISPTA